MIGNLFFSKDSSDYWRFELTRPIAYKTFQVQNGFND